ncbi:MAG: hypothetical protein IT210_17485 [Armatimonadetes bacterium]|nr:hypothetical protein [Armatimonadota bacterium]
MAGFIVLGALLLLFLGGCAAPAKAARGRRVSLNGDWQFLPDPDLRYSPERLSSTSMWRAIEVPSCWQAEFDDLLHYEGVAWYRKSFSIPGEWLDAGVVRLVFGAADYEAEVWVNNRYMGRHEGGYTPFAFEIQDALHTGVNLLTVKIFDPGDDLSRFPDPNFSEIPHGKQSWYAHVSGLWQEVFIEWRPEDYIEWFHLTPDIPIRQARAAFSLAHPPTRSGLSMNIRITAPDGRQAGEASLKTAEGRTRYEADIPLSVLDLWDVDHPALYRAEASIRGGDKIAESFGMRSIETRGGQILLNGHPIFLTGALDQDFYPLTIYASPSEAYLSDQFRKAKVMGLNCLRCHIKAPDPLYLSLADQMGLMVWYELPNWDRLSEGAKRRARQTLDEMLRRDYNHPSLVIISLINESWGADLSRSEDRTWLREMYDYAKKLDPTRLVVDNSPCEGNFHLKSDLDDFHAYFSIPDHAEAYSRWIQDFAGRPAWTYSPHGDADRQGDEPLILSEFGNWGLPLLSPLKKAYGGTPWWFETGDGNARPGGAEERFQEEALKNVFGSFDRMAQASQVLQFMALKYQIERLRTLPCLQGYVITEFTDLHWEANGLLDFCRNPKLYAEEIAWLQAPDIIIPLWDRFNYRAGETVEIPVVLSHYSKETLTDCALEWELEGFGVSGCIEGIQAQAVGPEPVGEIRFAAPETEKPCRGILLLTLKRADGSAVARNFQDMGFFPAHRETPSLSVALYGCGSKAARTLCEKGYAVKEGLARDADALVSCCLDEKTVRYIERGGRALILLETPDAVRLPDAPFQAVGREAAGRWGDWCSSFGWVLPEPPFSEVMFGPLLDFGFQAVLPESVLEGFGSEHRSDILSGLFVGWLHSPAALAVRFRYGQGAAIATTFKLLGRIESDPLVEAMFHAMLACLARPDFRPQTALEF